MILGIIGAFCLAVVALRRGEHVSALWIVVASVSVYLVAYRYYSLYIAQKVMKLDPTRATPAVINNDGLNYVPTNRYVLFGHHFAAIAGAGPLVGPGSRRADGLPAWHAVAAGGGRAGRCGSGFYGAVYLLSP
ncbi:carbon starvation family protein [Escherichia coli WV_060327]|nr:carbon starvation family protein [Escherichia coli WV_060327]